jgi:hypothetical protein
MDPLNALTLYLSSVLSVIAPTMREDRRASIATDIATVVLAEDRAFDDDANGQKTGLLLVSIAHYETGRSWASWIDTGKCLDPAWRQTHPQWIKAGDCDGGRSVGLWQIFLPDASVEVRLALAADRKAVIHAALAIARESIRSGVGLCHYSGETYPRCKLASARLETARNWAVKFPFRPEILLAGHDGDHATSGVE